MVDYAERIIIPLHGDEHTIFRSKSGLRLCTGYTRIVIGGRGPYVEFEERHLKKEHWYIPDDQIWRLHSDNAFYIEQRSKDDAYVKLYEQLKTVDYADYEVGKFYISPFDLVVKKLAVIQPLTKKRQLPKGLFD